MLNEGLRMKKTYEKPTLDKPAKLHVIAAAVYSYEI
jgi:hypothetical protein